MRIVIDVSAANDPNAHGWLDRTLYRIEDRWHVWETTGTPDLGALEATTWIGGRGALGDRESRNARRLREVCNGHGLLCWVLAKREAENYLPRVLLRERPNTGAEHARRVDAWESLSDDQKDFFDMKRGLPETPSAIEENLFGGLPEADREILATGFGPNVDECWSLWHVRDVGDELRTRGRGDLEHGIELIRREL